LDHKGLLDLVFDNQIANLFAPLRVRKEVVIAEKHHISRNRLQFFDDRFDGSFRIAPLLPERIETERAEFTFEGTPPRGQYGVECVAAESNTMFNHGIIMLSQGAIRKWNMRNVG
jgi:hypothetical protein